MTCVKRSLRSLSKCLLLGVVLGTAAPALAQAPTAAPPAGKADSEGFVSESRPADMTGTAALKENISATPLVAGAYGFIWLAVLVYVGSVAARTAKLEKETAQLHARLDQAGGK